MATTLWNSSSCTVDWHLSTLGPCTYCHILNTPTSLLDSRFPWFQTTPPFYKHVGADLRIDIPKVIPLPQAGLQHAERCRHLRHDRPHICRRRFNHLRHYRPSLDPLWVAMLIVFNRQTLYQNWAAPTLLFHCCCSWLSLVCTYIYIYFDTYFTFFSADID